MRYKRGDMILVDLPRISGSIQHGLRPCLIVQNNIGNTYSPVIIIVPCTSKRKKDLPTHVNFVCDHNGKENIALCEQIITVSKTDVIEKLCSVSNNIMNQIDKKLKISLGVR